MSKFSVGDIARVSCDSSFTHRYPANLVRVTKLLDGSDGLYVNNLIVNECEILRGINKGKVLVYILLAPISPLEQLAMCVDGED